MGPPRVHAEQSRNKLHFAPSIYSAIIKGKDAQIEKLEKDIKDLILQRDIAQAHVKELLQILEGNAIPMTRVGLGDYPHLRVRKSPEVEIQKKVTSVAAKIRSLDVHAGRGLGEIISGDHFVRVPYDYENSVRSNSSQGMSSASSYSDNGDSEHPWDGIEDQNKVILEDTCQETDCIEKEEISNLEPNYLFFEDYTAGNPAPAVKVRVNGEVQHMESVPSASPKDENFMPPPLKLDDNKVKEDGAPRITPTNKVQEFVSLPPALEDNKESIQQMSKNKKYFNSLQRHQIITSLENPLQYLGITSLENPSLEHHLSKGIFGDGNLSSSTSKQGKGSIITNSISPWLTVKRYDDYAPSFGSEKESEGFRRKIYTFKFGSGLDMFTTEDCPPPPESAPDIKFNNPVVNGSATEDGGYSNTSNLRRKAEFSTDKEMNAKPDSKAVAFNVNMPPKKNVKDGGVDPVQDECKVVTSWLVEFRRFQRQIIELWHACNVSLVHRTYFYLLYEGDPSDAIYLEVEIWKLKFLKDRFSQGEKATLNGCWLTLSSSKKELRNERQMLSKLMKKKFSEKERERLFEEWGIDLNSKRRRQQLAELVWTKTDDMNHIARSARLVANLMGITISQGHIFGLDFVKPNKCASSSGISTFKRSLVSIL